MVAPARFFRESYPELFNRGVALLTERAAESERAAKILADVRGARGVTWLRFEGDGDVWLGLDDGTMTASDSAPDGLPTRLAVALPADAAREMLEEARSADLASDEAAVKAARMASKRVEDAIGDQPLLFHIVVKDTPDFDEVVVKVALHGEAPPDRPVFTATVRWDDLAAIRNSDMNAQQLMMSGKLRLGGDYSRAMQVGMQLMQNPL